MSNVVEVEIKISQLLNDLRSGLTWYTKDGKSIQDKYGMEDEDIDAIKQHPAFLKPIKVFKIVDDVTSKEEVRSEVIEVVPPAVEIKPEPVSFQALEVEESDSLEFMSL